MRLILILALLLAPSICHAGPAANKLRGVMSYCSAPTGTVNSINGVTEFFDGGDTGTATPSTFFLCSGTASVDATCDGTISGAAAVYLVINGATAASLSCANGEAEKTQTLTAAVSGIYTARVYGDGNGYSAATNFVFPVAQ